MDLVKLKYRVALTMIKGVGASTARKLITCLGDEEAVFNTKKQILENIPGIGQKLSSQIRDPEILLQAERELEFTRAHGIEILFYTDDDYPFRLKECFDAPLILYKKGKKKLNENKYLGIVGTRRMTNYGKDCCEEIISGLAAKYPDLVIVSGMAYGVDICAHKKALDTHLDTVGVLGHGLDQMYPSSHKSVARKMMENGCLLSEYPSGTKIDRKNFVARNRIIAGLCDAILVVESGERGGALLTAEFADSYHRDVFALPGRINDNFSRGCNNLIKNNKAAMIENASDIIQLMNWSEISAQPTFSQLSLFPDLTEEQKSVVDFLNREENAHIDSIAFLLNKEINKTSTLLLEMEFNGIIKCIPGNLYMLK
jgi:DNA processing protein